MKRIICLILTVVLCLATFTGCELFNEWFGGETTDEGIENAYEYFTTMYNDLGGTHAKDFDVVAQVLIAGVKYPVTWTADNSSVSIRESVKPGYYTVDVPGDNSSDITFTLTATISSTTSDATKDKTFTIKVPAATASDVLSIPAAIELGKGQANSKYTTEKYYVSGKVTKIDNTTYGNLYIADEDGNELLVYGTYDATGKVRFDKMANQPKVGDTVTFYSVVGNYNGTPQLKNAWLTALNGEELGGGSDSGNGGNNGGGSDVTGGIILDMMGSTNIESHSNTQMIYSANGIVLTNDKNTSTTNCYNNTGSYAARFYGGATIKIEYKGMTKIVFTLDDYSPEAGKDYLKGFDGMTVEGATIVREHDVVTIYFAAATDVFQSAPLGSQIRVEQIEVFTGAVETPPAGGNGGNGNNNEGGNQGGNENQGSYTAPVAGQAYKFYLEQITLNKTLYFNGAMDDEKGTYLATTTDKNAAVDIYFEVVNGGYHIYFMNGNTKTYINAAAYLKDNGYAGCHFELGTEPICVWTYDTTYGILEIYDEIEGKSDTFFAGTYSDYETISLSGAYYKDQIGSGTQFPARIVLSEGGNTGNEGGNTGNEGGNTGNEGGNTGNEGGNTDNEGGNTGNEGGNTDNEGGNTGNQGGTTTPEVTGSASLDFSNVANRTEFDSTVQVWEQNGVKLTNNKGASTSPVADYSDPARFYKSSALTVEYAKIVKIEFACDTAAYAEALVGSIAAGNGTTVTVNGKVVTVVFSTAVDSFTVATLGAQVRMDSLTVYTGTAGGNTGSGDNNQGGNTGNEGGNTGNNGGNTGNEGGNTGNEGGNTGNEGGNTGSVSTETYDLKSVCTETITDTKNISTGDGVITFNLVANEMAANKAGQIRVYQNKSGVITSTKKVSALTFVANGKDNGTANVTVYVSNDGVNYTQVGTMEISTSAENSVSFGGEFTYIKIASAGKQLQITSLTFAFTE